MRPIRLEIEGFTAFKERTIVEFDGVETFVLSGPTGSGKSSIIDAITFALYGSVPRYNDTKLVHPIISQGLVEAKVRLDFNVGGKEYTAVRVVRKLKKGESWGATTKEARLECGDKVLAGNATELDQQIEVLFGLDFEQFTSCVVLPQGEFAKFLNSPPNRRQDLLKSLLRLQIYERIGSEARKKERDASGSKKVYEEQLSEYADIDVTDKKQVNARITSLEKLLKEAESIQKDLVELKSAFAKCEENLSFNEDHLELLEKVVPPKDYSAINDLQTKASLAHDLCLKKVNQAESDVEKLEKKLEGLGNISELNETLDSYEEKRDEESHLESLQKELSKVQVAEQRQAEKVDKLLKQRSSIEKELKTAQDEHSAYHLSKNLSKGQMCPVCDRPLTEKPQHSAPKDFKKKEAALKDAEDSLASSRQELQSVTAEKLGLTKEVSVSKKKLEALDKSLKGVPSFAQVKNGIQAFEQFESALEQARITEKQARREEKDVHTNLLAVGRQLKERSKVLDELRDSLAGLKPPALDKEKYKKAWDDFATWAADKKKELKAVSLKITGELTGLEKTINTAFNSIEEKLSSLDITVKAKDNVRDLIADNISKTKSDLRKMDEGLKKKKDLAVKIDTLKKTIDTAKSLAQHMSASHFERWLLQEAFENLVAEASKKLIDLTSGDYSFAIDEKLNFDIVDHKNADEKRTAKTLSGGETFLASLALALTLSEQIAELATEGSAPLESIFLDEGFGTLDSETLDTVATAIEELASKGRMIGLITHMKELADRIPVQYRVSKGVTTASVERVSL